MRDKPAGVQETALATALADGWGIRVRSTKYLPVGAGSYHWAVVDDGGLQDALSDLDRDWAGGAFSEPARRLLADCAGHVEQLLGDFDRLVEQVRGTAAHWVVTHGEPHPGNLIRARTARSPVNQDRDLRYGAAAGLGVRT